MLVIIEVLVGEALPETLSSIVIHLILPIAVTSAIAAHAYIFFKIYLISSLLKS